MQGLRGLHSVSLTFTRVRDELDWPFLLFVIYILQTIHEKHFAAEVYMENWLERFFQTIVCGFV